MSKKFRKILIIALAFLAALTLLRLIMFATKIIMPGIEKPAPVNVKTTIASSGAISSQTPISGRIVPINEVAVIPLASGRVVSVSVKTGDYVSPGQTLFTIDDVRAGIAYENAAIALDLAQKNYDRLLPLLAAGAISQSELDAAKANLDSAMQNAKSAKRAVADYNVTAPIGGYVTSLNVSVGGIAGTQNPAASIADTSSLKIETGVSEYIARYIKHGEKVDITVDRLENKHFTGTVTAFSPAPAMGTLTYPLTISVDDPEKLLHAGMFAEINIRTEFAENVITLPSDAVILKNGHLTVVTLDEKNIPTFRRVQVGIDNGEIAEIKSGIAAGDEVVISGQNFVTEGIAVKVVK